MIKKILLGVILLAIVGVVVMGYGTYKIADEMLKEKEPQLRQYVQLDEAAQNQFVLEHIGEFMTTMRIDIDKDGNPDDKETMEKLMKVNAQPEVQSALVNLGRSLVAAVVLLSEPIVKDLSADIKAKYEKEAEQIEARLDKYSELVEAADPSLKVEK